MWHAISRLWKSVNPEYERQNSKMKLREFHNVNCRFCGAIHDVDWANISVFSQVIRNVNERKTVQTNMISFVSHGDKTLWGLSECPANRNIIFRLYRFSFHKPIKSRLVRDAYICPSNSRTASQNLLLHGKLSLSEKVNSARKLKFHTED